MEGQIPRFVTQAFEGIFELLRHTGTDMGLHRLLVGGGLNSRFYRY